MTWKNLIMETKDLYNKKFSTLKKEIRKYTKRWKDCTYSYIRSINIVKITTLPKSIFRLKAFPIKILWPLYMDIEKFLKSTWNQKKPPNSQSNTEQNR